MASSCENANEMEIIRVASYHRRDFDLAVVRTNPRHHDEVRGLLLRTLPTTSSNIGRLELLPLEIVYQICFLLDIRSLFNFRHVNRRAHQMVRGTYSYEAVITHALEAFCVILRTNIASWFTINDLFRTLCTRDCHLCGSFGGFIFLPSFMRCCFSCIREDGIPHILPCLATRKRGKFNPGCQYDSVPTMRSLPGIYSLDEIVWKRRMYIVPAESAGTALHEEAKNARATQSKARLLLRYMVTTSLPYLDIKNGEKQFGICCSGCQISLEKALRSSRIHSNACALRDKVYSHEDFLKHFQLCPEAQNLWILSRAGVDVSSVSEFVRRNRCFR